MAKATEIFNIRWTDKSNVDGRAWHDGTKHSSYFNYLFRGRAVDKEARELGFSQIFNFQNQLTFSELKEIKEKFADSDAPIWHGFMSWKEDIIDDQESARFLFTSVFKKWLVSCGLNPDNITLIATLHSDTDNDHIHFQFVENEKTFQTFPRGHDGQEEYDYFSYFERSDLERAREMLRDHLDKYGAIYQGEGKHILLQSDLISDNEANDFLKTFEDEELTDWQLVPDEKVLIMKNTFIRNNAKLMKKWENLTKEEKDMFEKGFNALLEGLFIAIQNPLIEKPRTKRGYKIIAQKRRKLRLQSLKTYQKELYDAIQEYEMEKMIENAELEDRKEQQGLE